MYNEIRKYVIMLNCEGKIIFCNKYFLNRFDYSEKEILNLKLNEIIYNENDINDILNKYEEKIKNLKLRSKTNELIEIKAHITRENFNNNEIILIVGKEIYNNISKSETGFGEIYEKYNNTIKESDENFDYHNFNYNNISIDLHNILNNVGENILDYTLADGLSIFIYDDKEEGLKSVLKLKEDIKYLKNIDFIPLKKSDVKSKKYREYLNKTYKKNDIPNLLTANYNEIDDLAYSSAYILELHNEFLGVIVLSFKKGNFPRYKNHEYMKCICNKVAMETKNTKLSQEILMETKKRKYTENELENYLNVSVDLVATVGKDGYFKKISPNWTKVLGWTEEELLSMKVEEIIHPKDKKSFINKKKHEDINGRITYNIIRFRHKNGNYIHLEWNSIYNMDDEQYITTSRDITEKIKIERENKRLEQAIEMEIIKNEFFSNISHEFRTPLNIIFGTMQVMESNIEKNNIDKDNLKKYIKYIKQNSFRLLRLANNLIDISKMDVGAYTLKCSNQNIIAIIEDITLSVADYIEGNNIDLVFDTDSEEIITYCDVDKIERIMLNLLSNAIKYTKEKGCISVTINSTKTDVIVHVKDDGIGIPKEKLDIIFDRFGQVNTTFNRECEGSGIGLSIVKNLVEMHGGNITVNSKEGCGTEFVFTIPININEKESYDNLDLDRKHKHVERCDIEFSDIYS